MLSPYTPDSQLVKRLENDYVYHPPHGGQQERYIAIREGCKELALFLAANCPPSRELSLALTHLEQACLYSNAAIARNE